MVFMEMPDNRIESIRLDLHGDGVESVITELLEALRGHSCVAQPELLLRAILEREAEMPTSLGLGVAMPHARCASVSGMVVSAGRLLRPVAWGGPDRLVRHVFLIGVPLHAIEDYLKLIQRFTHAFKRSKLLAHLDAAGSPGQYREALVSALNQSARIR
jgi:mannitol/fructose-specific phosphotransferase system IIA component (Ntr-type)